MTTTAARPTRARPRPAGDSPFTGAASLIRLNLRLDRVRILAWTLAMGVSVWSSVIALRDAYPTQEALQGRAALLSNPATIMMTGPAFSLDNYTFGAAVANELSLYVFIASAIMSVLLSIRHTRAEEEAGRLELVRSLPVGRFAPATAAVVTVAVANLLVGAATSAGLLVGRMETESSLAFGAATGMTGLVFAALATVAAQLTEHARGASGMSMAVLAVAFLVRGVGDVINDQGSWLSWFSPLAWGQQTRLFVDVRWWPLAVSLVATVALFAVAVYFAQRRDIGAGLRPTRPGPATASRALHTPTGLAERLLRSSLLAWGVGAFFFAVAMGALANELDAMLEANPALEEWLAIEGTDLTAEFAGVILTFELLAPVIVAVAGVLRLRSEEESGRTEQMIVAGLSRVGYLAGWLGTVVVHTLLLTLISGAGVGLGVTLGTGEGKWIGELTIAALVFLPAILLVAALAVALHGVLPRLVGLAWALVVWISLVLFLGELLRLPDWAKNISPFTHTPVLPGQDFEAAPLLVMAALAVMLLAVGLAGFQRRDINSR